MAVLRDSSSSCRWKRLSRPSPSSKVGRRPRPSSGDKGSPEESTRLCPLARVTSVKYLRRPLNCPLPPWLRWSSQKQAGRPQGRSRGGWTPDDDYGDDHANGVDDDDNDDDDDDDDDDDMFKKKIPHTGDTESLDRCGS